MSLCCWLFIVRIFPGTVYGFFITPVSKIRNPGHFLALSSMLHIVFFLFLCYITK